MNHQLRTNLFTRGCHRQLYSLEDNLKNSNNYFSGFFAAMQFRYKEPQYRICVYVKILRLNHESLMNVTG